MFDSQVSACGFQVQTESRQGAEVTNQVKNKEQAYQQAQL